jgi:uncharacterized damage-inducible protein DinB
VAFNDFLLPVDHKSHAPCSSACPTPPWAEPHASRCRWARSAPCQLAWATVILTSTGAAAWTEVKLTSPVTAAVLATFDSTARLAELADRPRALGLGAEERVAQIYPALRRCAQVLNHTIHHRGQLSVYLRLNDVAVPSIYGPTADEA